MISILDKALQAILKMLQKKDERVLLWSNASPTSAYAKQKVALSLNAGDTVRIESCLFNNYTKRRTIQDFTVGQDGYLFRHLVILFGAQYLLTRQVFSLTMDRIHLLSITQIWIIRRVFRREYGL